MPPTRRSLILFLRNEKGYGPEVKQFSDTQLRRLAIRHGFREVTPNYPDTPAGALAYLSEDSTLDLTDAVCSADPAVDGVWMVETPNDPAVSYAIVYLAGYREPLGRLRECDDFECCHPETPEPGMDPEGLDSRGLYSEEDLL